MSRDRIWTLVFLIPEPRVFAPPPKQTTGHPGPSWALRPPPCFSHPWQISAAATWFWTMKIWSRGCQTDKALSVGFHFVEVAIPPLSPTKYWFTGIKGELEMFLFESLQLYDLRDSNRKGWASKSMTLRSRRTCQAKDQRERLSTGQSCPYLLSEEGLCWAVLGGAGDGEIVWELIDPPLHYVNIHRGPTRHSMGTRSLLLLLLWLLLMPIIPPTTYRVPDTMLRIYKHDPTFHSPIK